VHDGGDGVRVGDGVAGVDDQVRLEAGERADPGVLAVLGSGDVQVGDVQQPDRARAGWQDGDVEATQRARSYFTGYRPSSPSIALFRDGQIVKMIERYQIEGRHPHDLAVELKAAFNQFCAKQEAQVAQ